MFQENEYVMYGLTGVCKLAEKRTETSGDHKGVEYYILYPVKDESAKIMIPVRLGQGRMRGLITKEELKKHLMQLQEEDIWVDDLKERGKDFQERLKTGEFYQWLAISSCLYGEKKRKVLEGKKLSMVDEKVMKDAWTLMCEEVLYGLDITEDQMKRLINEEEEL